MSDGYTHRTYGTARYVDGDGVVRDGYPSEAVRRLMNQLLDCSVMQSRPMIRTEEEQT